MNNKKKKKPFFGAELEEPLELSKKKKEEEKKKAKKERERENESLNFCNIMSIIHIDIRTSM